VSAGEVSGDRMLGEILKPLRLLHPGLELRGLGGASAAACGLTPLFPMERTAISGVWDVARNAFFALRMHAAAVREMRRFRPHLVLLVDYPGLNLRLARAARNLGVPVYFVAPPQAWAYRDPVRKSARARKALRGCAVQVLFPFEMEAYGTKPISATTGATAETAVPDTAEGSAAPASPAPSATPAWGTLRMTSGHFFTGPAFRAPAAPVNDGKGKSLLCLCPGSRLPVLRRNLPRWLELLEKAGRLPVYGREIAIVVPGHLAEAANRVLTAFSGGEPLPGIRIRTDKEAVFAEARHAIAFPGTITLELALAAVPTLVMAILDPLTLAMGRRVLGSGRLALPNLILGQPLFPEWVGTAPGPELGLFRRLEQDRDRVNAWDSRLQTLTSRMGPGNGAEVAVRECAAILAESDSVFAARTSNLPVAKTD
jgi:lipid-A-disaccharide synthase